MKSSACLPFVVWSCNQAGLSVGVPFYISNFVVRAFAHGAMGRRIDPSWGGHIELFLVPASAPQLV